MESPVIFAKAVRGGVGFHFGGGQLHQEAVKPLLEKLDAHGFTYLGAPVVWFKPGGSFEDVRALGRTLGFKVEVEA